MSLEHVKGKLMQSYKDSMEESIKGSHTAVFQRFVARSKFIENLVSLSRRNCLAA